MATTKRPTLDLTALLAKALPGLAKRIGTLPNLTSARTQALRSRIAGAKATPSVCPYCAVGCSTLVYAKDNTIVDIEGNPDSPVNGGTLCPKGSAIYQLHVNPQRWTTCKYRAPYSSEWQDVSLEWVMQRVTERVKDTRDRTFREFDDDGRRVNRTMALASLGGATLDNEENYLITKLYRALGAPFVENQARI
jgi:formate dehydrogenase major subunit